MRSSATKTCREKCWILVGQRREPIWYARRIRGTTGDPASVDFDAAWVLQREEARMDVVGFHHTHPAGLAEPSDRDLQTMRAWVSAFGKPLLCLIETDGTVNAFRFDHPLSSGIKLPSCVTFGRGVVIAVDERTGDAHDEPQVPA